MGAVIEVALLGPVEVRVEGELKLFPGARPRLLLCRLLVDRGVTVPDWRLRADVWEGHEGSDGVLKSAVNRLRAILGVAAPALRRDGPGYVLERAAVHTDADRFEALVADARRTDDATRAATLLGDALALWRGAPFADLPDSVFLRSDSERLVALRDVAEEERFEHLLEGGQSTALVPELQAAVARRPARERLAGSLALALYRAGRPVDALDALRRTERYLRDEFGVTPGTAFRTLEYRILTHDPALDPAGVVEVGGRASNVVTNDPRVEVEATSRAADALARTGAPAEAARLASRAVAMARELDDARLLARALARYARLLSLAERGDEVAPVLAEGAALARSAGDGAALAQVAMARFGAGLAGDDPDALLADLVEPLALLPADAPECVDLLCAAMHQLVFTADSPSADSLLARAEALAADGDDRRAVAVAAIGRAVLAPMRHEDLEQHDRLAAIALERALDCGDVALRVVALQVRVRAWLERGRVADVAELLDDFRDAARLSQFPFAWLRAELLRHMVDLARGDLDGIEERVLATYGRGQRMAVASAAGTTSTLLALGWLEQERYAELDGLALARSTNQPPGPWHALHAWLLAAMGKRDDAVDAVDALAADRSWTTSTEMWRGFTPMFLGEAALLVQHVDAARLALEVLEPWAGHCLVIGHGSGLYGPVDRMRGLLYDLLGERDRAVALLEDAMRLMDVGGAPLWADRSAVALAAVLIGRDGPGDRDRARTLVARVVHGPAATRSLRLRAEADAVLAQLDGGVGAA